MMTEQGLAYLIWRDGQAFLKSKSAEMPPTRSRLRDRRFSQDLAAALVAGITARYVILEVFPLTTAVLSLDEQITYLEKGTAEIIREEDLRERLIAAAKAGRPLRVKVGLRPHRAGPAPGPHRPPAQDEAFSGSGPHRDLPDRRHDGMIGDPTGRNITRPPMTREQIEQNAETYKAQVFKILDPVEDRDPLQQRMAGSRCVRRPDPAVLASTRWRAFSSATISPSATKRARRSPCTNCSIRWRRLRFRGAPVRRRDGRHRSEIQSAGGPRDSSAITASRRRSSLTMPLLEGLDGVNKMSKSLGNYIGITEPPEVMFRKVMQIRDELMWRYYELLTDTQRGRNRRACGRKRIRWKRRWRSARRIVCRFPFRGDATAARKRNSRAWCGSTKCRRISCPCRCPKASRTDKRHSRGQTAGQGRPGGFGERCRAQDQRPARSRSTAMRVEDLVSRTHAAIG